MTMQSLSSLGAAVANHLWQSTAFAAAVWIVARLLRKDAARLRYSLWLAASIKFLFPFSLLLALGGLLPVPRRVVAFPQAAIYSVVDAVGQPFSSTSQTDVSVGPRASLEQNFLHALPLLLLTVWLCGVATVLFLSWARWREVSSTLRRSRWLQEGREYRLLQGVLQRMGNRRSLPMFLSQEPVEPAVFGLFRPVLVWPQQLSQRLEDEHIVAILVHENSHVHRHDNLTAAIHMLVEAIFWFHPLVWWIERRMVEERERACDEAVVTMGCQAGIYADGLLKACRFCVESSLACVAGVTGAELTDRVRSIMTLRSQKLTFPRKAMLAAFALMAVAVPIVFGQMQNPVNRTVQRTVAEQPRYEVATIKPDKDGTAYWRTTGDGFSAGGKSAQNLIQAAYGLSTPEQIVGLPKWASSELVAIQAKMDADTTATLAKLPAMQQWEERQRMFRTLLAERFALKVHHTTKQLPLYELTIAKDGSKMKRAPVDFGGNASYSNGRIDAHVVSMTMFATNLSGIVGRDVVDKTGLPGSYNFTLEWAPEGADPSDPKPLLSTAMEEQLGLKLKPTQGPVDTIVIDSIQRPSEN